MSHHSLLDVGESFLNTHPGFMMYGPWLLAAILFQLAFTSISAAEWLSNRIRQRKYRLPKERQ